MTQGILWAVIQQPAKLSNAKQQPLLITPRYPLGKPHHITLQYGVNRKDWSQWEGFKFKATTLYEAWNGNIQCVAIKLPEWIPCANQHPHISISWKPGISPVESNTMLASKFNYKLVDLQVSYKIEFLEWENNT